MMLRSGILRIVVFLLCVSVSYDVAAQRGGGGRGGGGGNPGGSRGGTTTGGNDPRGDRGGNTRGGNDPRGNDNRGRGRNEPLPEGATREDSLKFTDKARPMLEVVEMMQRRTGRPISYEDPRWEFEGTKSATGAVVTKGEVVSVPGFPDARNPTVVPKPIISLAKGSFEVRLIVDARTHLLPEPIDASINSVFQTVLSDYKAQQLPGNYAHAYLGDTNNGGFGWVVYPQTFKNKLGGESAAIRVLDYPITFPLETRPTMTTFDLIVQMVQKASGQRIELKHLASEATTTGRATTLEAVKLPAKQTVRIGANNETARGVLAKALRNIDRGDPRTQGPIPQRAWRLLYLIDQQKYVLDFVDVKQESYATDGRVSGTGKVVTWGTPTAVPPASGSAPPQP